MANLRMNDDLNIVAESPLVIEKLGDDLNIIQKLDDEPNDVGGMTSTELKETFDRSGNLIKAFINDKLIPAVLASDATEAARAAAETAREQAEAARKTAETAREQAETAREEHETVRVRQEQERVTAEQARDEAEKARVDSTTGIVAQATTQADAAKTAAQGAARDAEAAARDAGTAAAAAQSAAQDAGDAEASAGSAAKSEQAAQNASAESQSWAAGGTGTRPDEETNNAKYWAGVAEKAAGGGVTSFNGRAGVVAPQKGDYTAEMVGARPDTWTPGAADVDAVPTSEKGQPNGVATLDQSGKVPEAQIPERLSKGNLLSDETAAMLGLPNTATPNDAFSLLVARAPIGSVFWYTAQTAPAGYLICDGALVSRMDYAALFAVIGTTFGAGDGSTTFQLPDLRAAFVRGAGNQNGYSATLGAKQNASNLKFVKDRPRYGQGTTNFGLSGELNRGQTLYDMDKDERKVISYMVSASELWTETMFVSTGGVSNYIDISNQYVRPYNIALTPIIKY